jgi:hypothetical protein
MRRNQKQAEERKEAASVAVALAAVDSLIAYEEAEVAHQTQMRQDQKHAEERKEAASVAVALAAVASLSAYEEAAPALLAENARLRARVEQAEETIRKLRAQLNTNQNTYIAIDTTCY